MYLDVSEFFLDMYFLFFFSIKNTCKKNGNKLKKKYTYTISSFFLGRWWVWVVHGRHGNTRWAWVVCVRGHGGTSERYGGGGVRSELLLLL